MLHILLLILKILLWILLGILGLVLLIVLLVLFAPIHYRAKVKYDGKALVNAKVSFLFVALGLEFSQEEKNLSTVIRIAGIRLGGKAEKKKKQQETVEVTEKADSDTEEAVLHTEDAINETTDEIINEETNEITDEKADKMADEEADKITDEETVEKTDETVNEKPALSLRIKVLATKIKDICLKLSPESIMDTIDKKSDEISKKYNELEKKVKRYTRLWNLECTVKTKNYLKKYLPSLVRHIGPRKIKGYIHYGFGDPAKTGQITGYISLLPFVYQKKFSLQPDFYEKVIEADVEMKGYIILGYILRIALKPYLWRTVKVLRRAVAQNK